MLYNTPGTTESSVGTQIRTDFYKKKALVELKKKVFFGQLADVTNMPKHFGKTIKCYHYMPMLDDININDQGIDAAGASISTSEYTLRAPALVNTPVIIEAAEASFAAAHSDGDVIYITDSTQWLLLTDDTDIGYNSATTGGADGTEISDATVKGYIDACNNDVTATVVDNVITLTGQTLVFDSEAEAVLASKCIGGSVVVQNSGNLYGSSKDIGYIASKLPALSETGGRVNRVGFKRVELQGSIAKFGFFDEYTQESLDFDTDEELEMHINREMIFGANEMTEDALQIDLLNGAGVIRYAGDAVSNLTVTGEDGSACEVDYDDLMHLSIDLDNNRCPKNTKVITGSRMVDTKVVSAARVMYIGSEMIPTIEKMTDHFSNQAFIPLAHYAEAGSILNGEIGTVGHFRICVVPEMMSWQGAGAKEEDNGGYRTTNGRYDVYPMLVVGDASFTTIGFQTDGKTVKFKITHKKPGNDTADRNDPYGETGFMSIKWYYGSMILRSERIALVKSVARI